MKRIFLAMIGLVLLACTVMPASAFTMKSLSMSVAGNGDTQVEMNYDLSILEQTAVFFRLADPAAQLKSAFESGGFHDIAVQDATSSSAHLMIPYLATVSRTGGKNVTITTPQLSFERAQEVLSSYWFAPLVSPDFSPAVTTITFPDGYRAFYYDQITIPAVTHQVSQ
ncbi:MAG: hypothetical protein WC586_11760 [Methanoregula sp.]